MHTHTHTHIHTHTHTYIHTHIHTYIHAYRYVMMLNSGETVYAKHVLPYGNMDAGVLLRAAAQEGRVQMVMALLDAGLTYLGIRTD